MSSRHPGKHIILSGMAAGSQAALAYLGAMKVDIALTKYHSSDLLVIEGVARGRPSCFPWVGFLGHLANGAGLGATYALIERWLPGPDWLRGIFFSEGFLLLVWPTTPLLDRFHPLIRRGQLPPFARRVALMQNLGRHLVFGLVLATSLRILQRQASRQR